MTFSSSASSSTSAMLAGLAAAFCGGSILTLAALQSGSGHGFGMCRKSSKAAFFPATQNPQSIAAAASASSDDDNSSSTISYPLYDYWNQPKEAFLSICDMLIDDLVKELPKQYELPERETQWIAKMLNETVKGGKMNRGLMVVESGVAIMGLVNDGKQATNTMLCRLAVLGWTLEWLQAWLLIADDIMDSSVTRRGKPCWYKTLGDTWYIAINDAVTIESLVYKILRKHFAYDAKILLQLLDLMAETTLQTELGQLSDTLCDILDLKDLTPQRWELIVKYKTSFYSFYMSVAFGMILGGIQKEEAYHAARKILITMGIYFQAQDDYLDCYGTPEQIGKIGTDIADKKCGWLFTKAFHELASPEQKAFLQEHYGKCKVGSPEEVKIKELYTKLGLPKLYADYEQASYDQIMAMKDSETGRILKEAGVPWQVFESFLQKVYKRSK